MKTNPLRRTPAPSRDGDDPCFNCGRPGSTCLDCGEVLCAECNKQPYLTEGHEPAQHLVEPPTPTVVDLDLQVFDTRSCVMCGFEKATMRFCTGVCQRDAQGQIKNVGARQGRSAQPHIHHACEQCRYEWLTRTRPSPDVDVVPSIIPIENPLRVLTRETLVNELAKIERLLHTPLDQRMRSEAEVVAASLRAQLAVLP